MEMLSDGGVERRDDRDDWGYESALHEDESTRGASEMRDADKVVNRGGE